MASPLRWQRSSAASREMKGGFHSGQAVSSDRDGRARRGGVEAGIAAHHVSVV